MEIVFHGFYALFRVLTWLFSPLLWIISTRRKKHLPTAQNPLLYISATKLVQKIRSGELKSEDVIRAYINRIEEVDSYINGKIEERFAHALEEARQIDAMIASESDETLLQKFTLLGVPVSISEPCGVQDMSHTAAAFQKAGRKLKRDSLPVARLRSAGAIPLLVSTCSEYGIDWGETTSKMFGRTKNPYDTSRTVGPSGGEAALIGSAASLIGIGSDSSGSTRISAMFCGVFAHKPTALVSMRDEWPIWYDNSTFLVAQAIAPLTRYAEDLLLVLSVLAGPAICNLDLERPVRVERLKVFFATDCGSIYGVRSDVKSCIFRSVEHLKRLGCSVEEWKPAELKVQMDICQSKLFHLKDLEDRLMMNAHCARIKCSVCWETFKAFFHKSNLSYSGLFFLILLRFKGLIFLKHSQKYSKMVLDLEEIFASKLGENGVFIYPTFACPAYRHYECLANLSGQSYSSLFNFLGLPATHVPCGCNHEGLPVGVQIIGSHFQDRKCLALALELEKAFGGWHTNSHSFSKLTDA